MWINSAFSWSSHTISGALVVAIGLLIGGGFTCWGRPSSAEIFEGINYGCKPLQRGEQGGGVVHWLRVDLKAPGLELYVTPKDPLAIGQGWQYRLRRVGDVVAKERLAVAINGPLFRLKSQRWPRMSGDFANGMEPVVADHEVSHIWDDAYLLWFDDNLTPRLRPTKPIMLDDLLMAKWGIGGQDFWLQQGKVWSGDRRTRIVSSLTAVALNKTRDVLFLAVGTHLSPSRMFQTLADLGAWNGMLLDGGNSSSMAIGKKAIGVSPGAVYGGWRAVAVHFGIRAQPLSHRLY